MHGVIMVFFFLIPSIPATLGNFLLPLMLGAKDLAFPRINLLSWYLYIIGGLFGLVGADRRAASTRAGRSTRRTARWRRTRACSTGAVGVFIAGFSSILTGPQLHRHHPPMRAPGMTWFRMPLFVWAHYATSLIMILGTPVVAITILLVAFERVLRVGIFDPTIGGDPVLFQHLFWFYSHPAVYIMVLPGMGVISELIAASRARTSSATASSRSRASPSRCSASSCGAITCSSPARRRIRRWSSRSSATLVAVPSAIKMFNWTATLYKGSISYETPMLYGFGFIGLFLIGGLTGPVPRGDRPRRARARHLFRRRALPLHHGRRDADGVPGRPALLVAEDDRAAVSRRLGEAERAAGVRRFQPDVLPAVHRRIPRHAAAVSHVPAGVPGAERDVAPRAPRSWASATSFRWSIWPGRGSTASARGRQPVRRAEGSSGRRRPRRRPSTSIGRRS